MKKILVLGICALLLATIFSAGCIDFGEEKKKKDTTPPTISGVTASSITSSGATISWTTNEASSSVVEYGTTTGYGSTATGADGVISHSVTLSGLISGTTYHYRVKSADGSGNTAASGDYTFTTTSEAADTTPPVISNVQSSSVTSSSATITWTTNEPATSQVEYCTGTTYYSTSENTSLVTNHNVGLTGLIPSTTYTYNVESKDASDNLAVSSNYTFTTLSIEQPPTTVYVGGTGPGNYTTIQAGVGAANEGDTVFVYAGTYYEHITITKKINLVGEGKDTTIIDGGNTGTVIFSGSDGTYIANFTIRNGDDPTTTVGCGIGVSGSYNTIENCDIHSNEDGIELYSNNTLVKNCNVCSNDKFGISISGSYTSIQNCNLSYNGLDGICITYNSLCNEVTYCTLQNNDRWGIWISSGNNSVIHHNNFIDNGYSPQACEGLYTNSWDNGYPSGGNYWSDYAGVDENDDDIGDTPYNISGEGNQDRYPLMSPVGSEGNGEEVYAIAMGSWNQVTGEYIAYSSVIAVQPAGGINWDDITWQLVNVTSGSIETSAIFTHYYDIDADGYVEAGDIVRVTTGKAETFKVRAIVGGSMIYESASFTITSPETTTDRVVLAECFTGTWCSPCQSADGALDRLADEYPRTQLVILEWHDYDDYSPPDNSYIARENYYSITGFPSTWFDGVELAYGGSTNPDDTTTYNNYKQKIDMRLAISSNLTINIEGVLGDTIGTINATITALGPVTLSNLKARFVIYEDHQETVYVSGREYRLRYTVVNGTIEEPVSISEGQTVVFNKTFTIDSSWNRSKLGVVVFIQSDTTKEVLQAGVYNFVTTKKGNTICSTETRSASQPKSGVTAHGTISINGNGVFASQASANGWAGDGSEGNPYIIENYDINASTADGIDIDNTDVYFIIRNCVIHDGRSNYNYNDGICFSNVQNGKIENVTSYKNYYGISLLSSSNNNTISTCIAYNNYRGIYLSSSSNNQITNCDIYSNYYSDGYGIYLHLSSNNNITGSQIYNNDYGINLHYSSNNNIIANQIHNNPYGIWLDYSSNNEIHYNNIYNNTNYGIYILNLGYYSYSVNATYNYWGSEDGPSGVGPGTGDAVDSDVPYEPWLTELWSGGVPYLHITVTADPTTISSGETSTITITVTDGINPVSGATINLESNNGGSFSSVTDNVDGTYTVTFTAPTVTVQTVCRITSSVSKTCYDSGSGYVDVTVNPAVAGNHAPVINTVTANPTTVSTGGQVTITVAATDADAGDVLTYVYSCTGGTISGTGNTVTWVAPYTAGTYTVSVYANDGTVNSNSKSVSVTVTSPDKEEPKGFIPAFETAAFLVAMIGVCIILLRKRK